MKQKVVGEGKAKFIRLQPILDLLRAAIWTGRLADERPVSIMLIAEQESMKTECLKFFKGTSTLLYLSDLTSRGIARYKDKIEDGRVRHIVLLDFIRVVSHKPNVAERTCQALAAGMEEGEEESADAGGTINWKPGTQFGVLMSLTPSFFRKRRGRWRDSGFLTRFLPVSFHYTDSTVREIHAAIEGGHKIPSPQPELELNRNRYHYQVSLKPELAKILSQKARDLGERMQTYGFRYHRALRALVKAQARIERRGEVQDGDVAQVLSWAEFFSERVIEL